MRMQRQRPATALCLWTSYRWLGRCRVRPSLPSGRSGSDYGCRLLCKHCGTTRVRPEEGLVSFNALRRPRLGRNRLLQSDSDLRTPLPDCQTEHITKCSVFSLSQRLACGIARSGGEKGCLAAHRSCRRTDSQPACTLLGTDKRSGGDCSRIAGRV
jgi:hypothetical protein